MNANFQIIKKLRAERLSRGEAHLRACRDQKDQAAQTLSAAERAERVETVLRRGREQALYRGVLSKPSSLEDLSRLTHQLHELREMAEATRGKVNEAVAALNRADADVKDAQRELMRLNAAHRKWEEVCDRVAQAEEERQEAAEEDAVAEMMECLHAHPARAGKAAS